MRVIWETEVGDLALYAIEDGWSRRDPSVMFDDSDPSVWEANPQFLDDGFLRVSFGCFLLRSGDDLSLIDTGNGVQENLDEGANSGLLQTALGHLGIAPDEITRVVHTHLHPDHMGGDVNDGAPAFPNAAHWTHEKELEFWRSRQHLAADAVLADMDIIHDAGLMSIITEDHQIADSLTMIESFGHTPGHTSVLIASKNERAYIAGDLTHHPLQAVHNWNVVYDIDKEAAADTRAKMFAQLADSGVILAAGHYPRPGMGRVVSDEGFRVFTPAAARRIV
ncbi:MAG: MBL fold metallo-hydrolase [Acidimicrobiia bacterium]|nr:MBL fold metallo-hydrolase [Acidimicrobiia bacterium]